MDANEASETVKVTTEESYPMDRHMSDKLDIQYFGTSVCEAVGLMLHMICV